MVFSLFMMHGKISFGSEIHESPIVTQDVFHSQFQLDLNKYRDNNNMLRINSVWTKDARFYFW